MTSRHLIPFIYVLVVVFLLTACAPTYPEPPPSVEKITSPTPIAELEQTGTISAVKETQTAVQPTQVTPFPSLQPLATITPLLTPSLPVTRVPTPEAHTVQVDWPPRMRLGESDMVRLTLVPTDRSYLVVTEYPEHQVVTQTITIHRSGDYELFAVARLDGVSFVISPNQEQAQYLPPGESLIWRWSLIPRNTGQQRLAITLTLRWVPSSGNFGIIREVTAFSQGLDVQVLSLFGLSQAQALFTGLASIFLGSGLGLLTLVNRPRASRGTGKISEHTPNPELVIELSVGLVLSSQERSVLQTLFRRYARLIIKQEFLSGYSGARTFLALPIRSDGRADAHTIAKIGERLSILREFENYETFVKDTLPPITARIQQPPVALSLQEKPSLAALQYTFIGEPGSSPTSLYECLLSTPDPNLLSKLLETFGPNWWLQRKPYTFCLGVEYDRVLPTHLVLEPATGKSQELDGSTPPAALGLQIGDFVRIRNFPYAEQRADRCSLSLQGTATSGQPPLRLRWLSLQRYEGSTGRVVATRETLLRSLVTDFDLLGLPDPLERLSGLLSETVTGSQSMIHGDLNLQNVLVGPGNMVWLIDFAQTRDGHTLFDFAHLEAEIIAHILAPKIKSPDSFLSLVRDSSDSSFEDLLSLITTLHDFASRCLSNPLQPREYHLALSLSCLGALKHSNLDAHSRYFLYLMAALIIDSL